MQQLHLSSSRWHHRWDKMAGDMSGCGHLDQDNCPSLLRPPPCCHYHWSPPRSREGELSWTLWPRHAARASLFLVASSAPAHQHQPQSSSPWSFTHWHKVPATNSRPSCIFLPFTPTTNNYRVSHNWVLTLFLLFCRLIFILIAKVGVVLKNSGYLLQDRHKNF